MPLSAVENVSERDIEHRFFSGFLSGADSVSHEAALRCFALLRNKPAFKDENRKCYRGASLRREGFIDNRRKRRDRRYPP